MHLTTARAGAFSFSVQFQEGFLSLTAGLRIVIRTASLCGSGDYIYEPGAFGGPAPNTDILAMHGVESYARSTIPFCYYF